MPANWFAQSPEDEQQMFDQLRAQDARRENYMSQASPAVSAGIGQMAKLSPYAAPGVILAAGQIAGQGGVPVQVMANTVNGQLAKGYRPPAAAAPDNTDPGFTATQPMANFLKTLTPEQQALYKAGPAYADNPEFMKTLTPEQQHEYVKIAQQDTTTPIGKAVDPSTLQPSSGFSFDWSDPFAFPKAAWEGTKEVTRAATGVAQSGWELAGNVVTHQPPSISSAAQAEYLGQTGGSLGKAAEQQSSALAKQSIETTGKLIEQKGVVGAAFAPVSATTGYQMFVNGYDAGDGVFPNPESVAGRYQAQAAREARGVVPGTNQAWTMGRQIVYPVFDPGSTPYNVASGLIDASAVVAFDPANLLIGKASEARAAGKIFEVAPDAAKADAAGVLVEDVRKGVNPMRGDIWLQSDTGQIVKQSLADMTSRADIHRALNGRAPVELTDALARAKTPEQVSDLIRPYLGTAIRSTTDIQMTRPTYKAFQQIQRALPEGLANNRQFASVPARILRIGHDATPQNLTDAVTAADDWMRLVEVPTATRNAVVDGVVQKLAEGDRMGAAHDLYGGIRQGLIAQDVPEDIAQKVTRMFDNYDNGLFGVDELGRPMSLPIHVGPDGAVEDVSFAGPGLLSERLSSNVEMPDPRQIKALTSPLLGKLVRKGDLMEEMRFAPASVEYLTNIWKRLTILRIATAIRVSGDEQARLAMSGLPSLFNHPIHWIQMVAGKHEALTALGEHFDDAAALGHLTEYAKALNKSVFGALRDPNQLAGATHASGAWIPMSKMRSIANWKEGMVDEIRQLAADPIARRIANGQNDDQIISWLRSDGSGVYDDLKQMGTAGRATVDPMGNRGRLKIDYGDEAHLRDYLAETRQRVATKVGDNPELLHVIGKNAVATDRPLYEEVANNHDLQFVSPGSPGDADWGGTSHWIGATVKNRETGLKGVVVDDLGNGTSRVSYSSNAAFDNGQPTDGLHALIDDWAQNPNSPDTVKWAERVKTKGNRANLQQRLDSATSTMVNALFDFPVSRLTRSPAFREIYYQEMARYAEHLAPEEANKLLRNLGADAEAKGLSVSGFLGGDKLRDTVIDSAKRAAGDLTVEDLDYYAKGHALQGVLDLLYDSTRRSNFGDALRTLVPFGQAFAEVFTSWGKVLTRNPETLRKAQLVVNGARGAGFFYTDPTSGKEMFTVPGADWIIKRITGQNVQVAAPVQGLNLIGGFLPTLGPAVQIPAAWLFQHTPAPQELGNLVLPYGSPPLDENSSTGGIGDLIAQGLAPSWLKTAMSLASSPDSTSQFGNIYTSVLKDLAASGNYSNDDAGRQKMKADAESKARTLTILQTVGKFVLPSSPSYDWKAATKQGDMLVSYLAADFHKMQQENYETAVQRFIDTYGEPAYNYVQSKTKAVNGGLDVSQAFGQWEQDHRGFMDTYKDVGGYFGPTGNDFDFSVYNRQLATGERRKLSGDELINETQATIARMKYYKVKDQIGDKPNAAQVEWLRGFKAALQKQYPGWGMQPSLSTAEFNDKVFELDTASHAKQMEGNDTATGVRQYLAARKMALDSAGTATLQGDNNAQIRAWLAGVATTIMRDHPGFARVYDQVLSQEVE